MRPRADTTAVRLRLAFSLFCNRKQLRHPHVEPLAGFGFGNFVFCDHRAFTANFFGQRVESRQKLCFQVPSGHWYCVPVQRPLFELCCQSTTATITS